MFIFVVCATKKGRRIDNCTSFTRKITDFSRGFNEGETDCTANIDWIGRGRRRRHGVSSTPVKKHWKIRNHF